MVLVIGDNDIVLKPTVCYYHVYDCYRRHLSVIGIRIAPRPKFARFLRCHFQKNVNLNLSSHFWGQSAKMSCF